jgi:hypothetical protein
MEELNRPEKSHKITVRVLAAGFSAAWSIMQIPYCKTTLDFVYYGHHIDLFIPVNVILFIGMMGFGVITGGTFLTNIKGNDRE